MTYIIWYIKNQYGLQSPFKLDEYEDYEKALEFYKENKANYRTKGVLLELIVKNE